MGNHSFVACVFICRKVWWNDRREYRKWLFVEEFKANKQKKLQQGKISLTTTNNKVEQDEIKNTINENNKEDVVIDNTKKDNKNE